MDSPLLRLQRSILKSASSSLVKISESLLEMDVDDPRLIPLMDRFDALIIKCQTLEFGVVQLELIERSIDKLNQN